MSDEWGAAGGRPGRRDLFGTAVGVALLILAGAHGTRGNETVKVEARAEPREAGVGEPIRYTITVTHPEGVAVTFPDVGEVLGDWTVERRGAAARRKRAGAVVEERWYLLSSYTVGEHAIPPPVVTQAGPDGSGREARGPSVTVTVRSALPPDWESQDIRGLKPPVARARWLWWLLAVSGVALLGAGLWWWRAHRATAASGPPPKRPHEIALEALEALRQQGWPTQGWHEAYYLTLSGIVRRYVEGRFGLRAPEMTTEEFLQAASQSGGLVLEQRQLLQDFLGHCDLVKFARYQPSTQEAGEAFQAALRLVQETMPPITDHSSLVTRH